MFNNRLILPFNYVLHNIICWTKCYHVVSHYFLVLGSLILTREAPSNWLLSLILFVYYLVYFDMVFNFQIFYLEMFCWVQLFMFYPFFFLTTWDIHISIFILLALSLLMYYLFYFEMVFTQNFLLWIPYPTCLVGTTISCSYPFLITREFEISKSLSSFNQTHFLHMLFPSYYEFSCLILEIASFFCILNILWTFMEPH